MQKSGNNLKMYQKKIAEYNIHYSTQNKLITVTHDDIMNFSNIILNEQSFKRLHTP